MWPVQTSKRVAVISLVSISAIPITLYLISKIIIYRSSKREPNAVEHKDKLRQQISIKDRKIGYREYGKHESKNIIFYCHGHPGSSLEMNVFWPFFQKHLKCDVRLIALDRPGHGLSSYYHYTPETCVSDLSKIADELHIKSKFVVMGISGGCPFALAAAAFIPNRLKAVITCIGCCPYDTVPDSLKGAAFGNKMIWSLPYATGSWIIYLAAFTETESNNNDREKQIESMVESKLDRAFLIKYPSIFANMFGPMKDAFFCGISGVRRSHFILKYYRNWGFKIEDACAAQIPIYAFFAMKDMNVPISHGLWFKSETQNYEHVQVTFRENQSHLSMLDDIQCVTDVINKLFL